MTESGVKTPFSYVERRMLSFDAKIAYTEPQGFGR